MALVRMQMTMVSIVIGCRQRHASIILSFATGITSHDSVILLNCKRYKEISRHGRSTWSSSDRCCNHSSRKSGGSHSAFDSDQMLLVMFGKRTNDSGTPLVGRESDTNMDEIFILGVQLVKVG